MPQPSQQLSKNISLTNISNNFKKSIQCSHNSNQTIKLSSQCSFCHKTFISTQQQSQQQLLNTIQINNKFYCQFCLQSILIEQQQQIKNLQQKYIYYKQYESSFNSKQYYEISLKNSQQYDIDIKELQILQKQSKQLDMLLQNTKQQCKQLKQKVILIQAQQQKFWDSINRFQKRAIKLQDKCLTAKLQKQCIRYQYQQLTRTSLYHKVFQITIKDNIGYIYGLAMGKRPDLTQFPWDQFNVGLGHLLLGFNILSLKYDYAYVKFHLIELRSNLSQVVLYGKDKKYPIAYTKENQKIFGEVMEALLVEFAHLNFHMFEKLNLEHNQDVKLPYIIKHKQFKIADIYINPNKITDKQKWNKWSQAIKYFLINFKHLLTIHAIYGKQ